MPDASSLLETASKASPWGAVASAAGGLINSAVGLFQRHKGKKLLEELGDAPDEQIPNEVLQNQEMAQLNTNVGLPSEQYNRAMKNIQRQQMLALSKANDRRGGLLTIAANNQTANDALGNLDEADAKARLNNEKTLYDVNNRVAGWRDKVWNNNVKQKWDRKYQYANSLLGAGNQNATIGLDQIVGAGATYGASGGFNGSGNNRKLSYHDYLMG